MGPSDASGLAAYLTDRFGLPLAGRHKRTPDGDVFELRPEEVYPAVSFILFVRFSWRSLVVEMTPGAFAGELVRSMGEADEGSRAGFVAIARLAREERGTVQMVVNGQLSDPAEPAQWPTGWQQLILSVQSPPQALDGSSAEMLQLARHWSGRLLGMVLSLAAASEESIESGNGDVGGLPEGARVRVAVNRYERSLRNRAICIEVHGSSCKVCGFDFGRHYGELGEGFIHVHHITPVSRLTQDYVVNPVHDLVPVCPNCHAMLHRTDPPLSPDALRVRLVNREEAPSAPRCLGPGT